MPKVPGRYVGRDARDNDVYRPIIRISISVPGKRTFEADAIVDSGADFTTLRSDDLEAVGVLFESLPLHGTAHGVAGVVEDRSCEGLVQYKKWTVCQRFSVVRNIPMAVVGREDFFKRFVVNFQGWGDDPPTMMIYPKK
jgi:hypothetical protein